jgi:hypothetical protein
MIDYLETPVTRPALTLRGPSPGRLCDFIHFAISGRQQIH